MREKDIYPEIWEDGDPESVDYLLQFFPTLQQFYADAAARGDAVIHWMA